MNSERFYPAELAEYIEKVYIDIDEDVAFKRIYEACNIFGGYKTQSS